MNLNTVLMKCLFMSIFNHIFKVYMKHGSIILLVYPSVDSIFENQRLQSVLQVFFIIFIDYRKELELVCLLDLEIVVHSVEIISFI